MSAEKRAIVLVGKSNRRQLISGVAVILGGLAVSSKVWGKQSTSKETEGSTETQTRTSLHQEVVFKASSPRVYETLLSSKQFAAFSGAPAEIDSKPGGAFSMFGGMIAGRNVELVPGQRIVQAWRPTHWAPGIYSIVRFELKQQGKETLIVLDHTGFPEGEFDQLSSGWKLHYWKRLTKFFIY